MSTSRAEASTPRAEASTPRAEASTPRAEASSRPYYTRPRARPIRKDLPVSTRARYLIKFKHGDLAYLRERLLADLSSEHFAVLLGKTQKIDGYTIINVIDLLFPGRSDYHQQNVAFLRIKKDFIHQALVELTNRYDVDTIIDVHTHPFSQGGVAFSTTDDGDEQTFF